jgi:hypothetical protein
MFSASSGIPSGRIRKRYLANQRRAGLGQVKNADIICGKLRVEANCIRRVNGLRSGGLKAAIAGGMRLPKIRLARQSRH